MSITDRRVVRSEWVKLRSLRSIAYGLTFTILAIVGIGIFSVVGEIVTDAGERGSIRAIPDPAGGALTGIPFALWAVAGLGVLAVTGEYATGMIRPTLTAVPRRLPVLWGKVVVLTLVIFTVTAISLIATFIAAKAILATDDRVVSLTDPAVARAVIGAPLYLTVVALLAAGFGWLVRSTAGALAALLGLLYLLPVLGLLLPGSVSEKVAPYLSNNAGTTVLAVDGADGSLPPWAGFGVFLAHAAVALALAAVLLKRRDA